MTSPGPPVADAAAPAARSSDPNLASFPRRPSFSAPKTRKLGSFDNADPGRPASFTFPATSTTPANWLRFAFHAPATNPQSQIRNPQSQTFRPPNWVRFAFHARASNRQPLARLLATETQRPLSIIPNSFFQLHLDTSPRPPRFHGGFFPAANWLCLTFQARSSNLRSLSDSPASTSPAGRHSRQIGFVSHSTPSPPIPNPESQASRPRDWVRFAFHARAANRQSPIASALRKARKIQPHRTPGDESSPSQIERDMCSAVHDPLFLTSIRTSTSLFYIYHTPLRSSRGKPAFSAVGDECKGRWVEE